MYMFVCSYHYGSRISAFLKIITTSMTSLHLKFVFACPCQTAPARVLCGSRTSCVCLNQSESITYIKVREKAWLVEEALIAVLVLGGRAPRELELAGRPRGGERGLAHKAAPPSKTRQQDYKKKILRGGLNGNDLCWASAHSFIASIFSMILKLNGCAKTVLPVYSCISCGLW